MGTYASASRELVLDRYLLLERLGSGGFGTVFLAEDERLEREVAVKRIARSRGPAAREERRRAAREALAAARLSHPAIVALYEAGADEDAYYLVSELVRGPTLAELFAGGGVDDRKLLHIGGLLAEALAHAHARGVVHRDVKPHNVIVPDEQPVAAKLADFGVARIAGAQPLTRTGDIVGTLAYMAPEQAERRPAGAAADLYSLALTLYEGFAGFNPVRAASPAATVRRIGSQLPSLARARPDLSSGLCGSIDRALHPDPTRRGSLADLRSAMHDALLEVADGARPRRPARRPIRLATGLGAPLHVPRRTRIAGAAAGAALAGAALASGLAPRGSATPLEAAALAGLALLVAPRAGFAALSLLAVAWLGVAGEPGAALVLLLALAPVPFALRSSPWLWSAPALAPALGVLGLAGAFPALAGTLEGPWRRATLGGLAYIWLTLCELLYDRRLLLGIPPSARPRGAWQGSVPDAVTHALLPLARGGGLLLALVWAVAALVAPWILRPRALLPRVAAAIAWAALLLAGSLAVAAHAAPGRTMALIVGAAAGATVAVFAGSRLSTVRAAAVA